MKKFLYIFLAALVIVSSLSLCAFAKESVGYVSYNKGNDANDGLSSTTAKKSIGPVNGKGAVSLVKNGGTLVVSEKMYFGDNYTLDANG